jgi:hypothetical protein
MVEVVPFTTVLALVVAILVVLLVFMNQPEGQQSLASLTTRLYLNDTN